MEPELMKYFEKIYIFTCGVCEEVHRDDLYFDHVKREHGITIPSELIEGYDNNK